MTKRTLLLAVPLALIVLAVGAYALAPQSDAPIAPPALEETTENVEAPAASPVTEPTPAADPVFASAKREAATTALAPETATMVIEGASFPVRVAEGSTIEAAMAALKAEGAITYELRSYTGLGSFVKSINGKSDTSEYYWILHVNGKKSATGISQTRISSGDVIEWKYEHKY